MPFDYSAYVELQKRQAKNKPNPSPATMPPQAEVSGEWLTHDAAWDRYLSYLSANINAATEQIGKFQSFLADPGLHDPNRVAEVRAGIFRLTERIEVLRWASELPKFLKEHPNADATSWAKNLK